MLKWVLLISAIIGGSVLFVFISEIKNPDFLPIDLKITKPAPKSDVLNIVHQYKDGVHRFSGSIVLPHSCYVISRSAFVAPDDQNTALLEFATEDISRRSTACALIPTSYGFDMIVDKWGDLKPRVFIDNKEQPITEEKRMWTYPNEVNRVTR